MDAVRVDDASFCPSPPELERKNKDFQFLPTPKISCWQIFLLNRIRSFQTAGVWQNLVYELIDRQQQPNATPYHHFSYYIMEPMMEEMREMSITRIIRWVSAAIMIFGGVIPYIPQYREIYLKDDAEGFSLYVCLALLIANTLRILFWFGKRYELPLLLQSIVMNVMMLAMIHLCIKVKNKNTAVRGPDRVFTDFDWRYFWQWTDFQSYIDFLLAMSIVLSFITFLFLHSPIYVESIGFLALFTEAMLGVPQLLKNLRHKSTEGMSILMVLMWTGGDAFKTVYFVVRQAPLQFWVCGSLQVFIDIIILGQVYWFRDNSTFRASRPD